MASREEQVRVEAELAKQLLDAPQEERQQLYGKAYDRIYEMALERDPDVLDFGATAREIPTLIERTRPGDRVLEVGCGMGLLAIGLRDAGRVVTAVDVSQVALDRAAQRAGSLERLEFVRVTSTKLPFADGTYDFAYSVEVVEHLHEQDAHSHFAEVARVLRPGGRYWFMTPSRYASVSAAERFGVSANADADVHLKEWTHGELRPALRHAGFSSVTVPLSHSGRRAKFAMPSAFAALLERVPGLPTAKAGYILGLNQCIVCAAKH